MKKHSLAFPLIIVGMTALVVVVLTTVFWLGHSLAG
jgi:hypothetical protein